MSLIPLLASGCRHLLRVLRHVLGRKVSREKIAVFWQKRKTNLRATPPGLVGGDKKVCCHKKGSILGRRHHIVGLVPDLVLGQFCAADPDGKAREMRSSPSA